MSNETALNPTETAAIAKLANKFEGNAAEAAEAKRLSATRVRSARAGVSVPGLIGSGDPDLPAELRNFDPGPFIQPVDEADYRQNIDTIKMAEAFEKERQRLNKIELERDAKEYQWSLRCRNCNDHALYFVRPIAEGETVGMQDWVARYKPKPEDFWDRPPVCQVCLHKGSEQKIDIEQIDLWKRTWVPSTRWLCKTSRDPERFRFEGTFRAYRLRNEAANAHIADLERRRALYAEYKRKKAIEAEREVILKSQTEKEAARG